MAKFNILLSVCLFYCFEEKVILESFTNPCNQLLKHSESVLVTERLVDKNRLHGFSGPTVYLKPLNAIVHQFGCCDSAVQRHRERLEKYLASGDRNSI